MSTQETPPAGTDPSPVTPFEWIGGETVVRRLVDRFYDLMDLEPAYTALRAAHGPELD
ncbi:MAG: globin, partial [Burkholderiaceae bacterium]